MAAIKHTMTGTYAEPGETVKTASPDLFGNAQADFDENVPAGTDTFYNFNLKRTELVSMVLFSDQGCIVCTNGPGFASPPTNTDKITLNPGEEYMWKARRDGFTAGPGKVQCPISADIVTGIYVTTTSSPPALARLRIKALQSK